VSVIHEIFGLGYVPGRDEDKASALKGLGDIGHGLTVITKGKLRYKMAYFHVNQLTYTRLLAGAADSPITQDNNQVKFGLGVMRKF
jgi:outer membrane scaffolding protein for murein synthesis (MipA/OmpV family)